MSDNRYNGWTNYETWNLALWIDNDHGSYEYWRDQARDAWRRTNEDEDTQARKDEATHALAQSLESETRDNAPAVEGFYSDVLSVAIGSVNFYEIAENWIDEVAEKD